MIFQCGFEYLKQQSGKHLNRKSRECDRTYNLLKNTSDENVDAKGLLE